MYSELNRPPFVIVLRKTLSTIQFFFPRRFQIVLIYENSVAAVREQNGPLAAAAVFSYVCDLHQGGGRSMRRLSAE